MNYPHLFSPIKLGGVTVPNRIVMTAHGNWNGQEGYPLERYQDYYERRARGGVGLIITEASPVHDTSHAFPSMVKPYDRKTLPAFEALARKVKKHGTKLFGQLYHCGAQASYGAFTELPLWAPSAMRGLGSREIAHAMTRDEIQELVAAFTQTAVNWQDAGFDGAELHGGHGYLINQFLSSLTNRREDEYGGSLENRTRFVLEVMASVRKAVGREFGLGIRLSAEEFVPGGMGLDEIIKVAGMLEATQQLDYLNISNGTHESYALMIPNSVVPPGATVGLAQAVKSHVSLPISTQGRIHHPALAEEILASGKADLIGMLRALIADPDLPKKAMQGKLEELRPCIGANHCLWRIHHHAIVRCAANPIVGKEAEEEKALSVPPTARKVAVVGAGPAGLEAAAMAAERGCQVTLYDARNELGGRIGESSLFPSRSGYADLIRYYQHRLTAAGVQLALGSQIDDLASLSADADAVIVATGSVVTPSPWRDRDLEPDRPWAGPSLFNGNWRELVQKDLKKSKVLLIESQAVDYAAATVADYLAEAAAELVIVTAFENFATEMDAAARENLHRQLSKAGTKIYARSYVQGGKGEEVLVYHSDMRETVRLTGIDLVISTGPQQSKEPMSGAKAGVRVIYAGDCVAPRGMYQAVLEGHRAALAL